MQPSRAERFFMDQQRNAADAQAAQAAFATQAAQAARVAQHAFQANVQDSRLKGHSNVTYEEKTFLLGTLELQPTQPDNHYRFAVPLDLSRALSVIVCVTGRAATAQGQYLWWFASTGFDDNEMFKLKTPEDDGSRLIFREGSSLIRLHSPFTKRFALSFFARESNQFNSPTMASTWQDVTVKLGYQTF